MSVLNNRTQYENIYLQALQIVVWKDFPAAAWIPLVLLLREKREGKISWDSWERLRNEETLLPVSLGKLLVAGGFWGSSSFGAPPLALPPDPGVDPCVLPRTRTVPAP